MYIKNYEINRGCFNSEIQLTLVLESTYEEVTLYDRLRNNLDFTRMIQDHIYFSRNEDSFKIKKVIFNNPATIVIWNDGTKTVVKCGKDDVYDEEKGLALCFMKKALGNKCKGHYENTFKKYIKRRDK